MKHNIIVIISSILWASLLFSATVEEYDPDGDLDDFNYDPNEDVIWKEQQIKIPKLSSKDTLSPIDIEFLPHFKVYVDQATLTINPKDKVTRLWVLLVSNRNAKTAQFIGIQCEKSRYKTYAYQTKKGIKKLKKPRWNHLNSYYKELARDYLCSIQNHPLKKNEIHSAITYNQKFDFLEE